MQESKKGLRKTCCFSFVRVLMNSFFFFFLLFLYFNSVALSNNNNNNGNKGTPCEEVIRPVGTQAEAQAKETEAQSEETEAELTNEIEPEGFIPKFDFDKTAALGKNIYQDPDPAKEILEHTGGSKINYEIRARLKAKGDKIYRPKNESFVEEYQISKLWKGMDPERVKLLQPILPKGVSFIDHQLLNPVSPTTIKVDNEGHGIMFRAEFDSKGREMKTNVIVSKMALWNNLQNSLEGKENYLVGEHVNSVIVHLHGGGTGTTGAHAALTYINAFQTYGIAVLGLDFFFHGEGPKNLIGTIDDYLDVLADFVRKFVHPNVQVYISGHSWGGSLTHRLLQRYGEARATLKEGSPFFFFHKRFKGIIILSPAIDSFPGGTLDEKIKAHIKSFEASRSDLNKVSASERDLVQIIVTDGKFNLIGEAITLETILELDDKLPEHAAETYTNALFVIGQGDPLTYTGNKSNVDKYYDSGSLPKVDVYILGRYRKHSRIGKNDGIGFGDIIVELSGLADDYMELVGHLLQNYVDQSGQSIDVKLILKFIKRRSGEEDLKFSDFALDANKREFKEIKIKDFFASGGTKRDRTLWEETYFHLLALWANDLSFREFVEAEHKIRVVNIDQGLASKYSGSLFEQVKNKKEAIKEEIVNLRLFLSLEKFKGALRQLDLLKLDTLPFSDEFKDLLAQLNEGGPLVESDVQDRLNDLEKDSNLLKERIQNDWGSLRNRISQFISLIRFQKGQGKNSSQSPGSFPTLIQVGAGLINLLDVALKLDKPSKFIQETNNKIQKSKDKILSLIESKPSQELFGNDSEASRIALGIAEALKKEDSEIIISSEDIETKILSQLLNPDVLNPSFDGELSNLINLIKELQLAERKDRAAKRSLEGELLDLEQLKTFASKDKDIEASRDIILDITGQIKGVNQKTALLNTALDKILKSMKGGGNDKRSLGTLLNYLRLTRDFFKKAERADDIFPEAPKNSVSNSTENIINVDYYEDPAYSLYRTHQSLRKTAENLESIYDKSLTPVLLKLVRASVGKKLSLEEMDRIIHDNKANHFKEKLELFKKTFADYFNLKKIFLNRLIHFILIDKKNIGFLKLQKRGEAQKQILDAIFEVYSRDGLYFELSSQLYKVAQLESDLMKLNQEKYELATKLNELLGTDLYRIEEINVKELLGLSLKDLAGNEILQGQINKVKAEWNRLTPGLAEKSHEFSTPSRKKEINKGGIFKKRD